MRHRLESFSVQLYNNIITFAFCDVSPSAAYVDYASLEFTQKDFHTASVFVVLQPNFTLRSANQTDFMVPYGPTAS